MCFQDQSYLLSGFHFAGRLPQLFRHRPWFLVKIPVGCVARGQDPDVGWMERGGGKYWRPGAPCSEQVLLSTASNAELGAEGLPAPTPTALAFADEAEGRKGTLLMPQHCRARSAHSGACRAQAGSHVNGPHENCQDPLLECTESELPVQSWMRPRHSCLSLAQAVLKGSTHWKMSRHLPWAATQVPEEAQGVPGSHPQHLCEAQADQSAEETLARLGLARRAGCFWTNCPTMCSGAPVY